MPHPAYPRRRRSLLRRLIAYRRLVLAAFVLGLLLWFILANSTAVTINFPFGLGKWQSTVGLVILISALFGSLATGLLLTIYFALRWGRDSRGEAAGYQRPPESDELPPSDYAAKTADGLSREEWS